MTDQCQHCCNGFLENEFGQDVECVNGVLIDIDEAHEYGGRDRCYPVAPCHPMWQRQSDGDEDFENDCQERLAAWADQKPAALASAARHCAWRPIAETPDRPMMVNLFFGKECTSFPGVAGTRLGIGVGFWTGQDFSSWDRGDRTTSPTHWTPVSDVPGVGEVA